MKKLLILSAAALALTACSKSETPTTDAKPVVSTAAQNQNEKLDAWFETVFDAGLKHYPQFMTSLGMKDDYDKWNDPSKAFNLDRLDETRQELEYLRANFNPGDLDEAHALSYSLFERDAVQSLADAKWWDHNYPFNQMFGVQSGIPAFLINRHRIDSVQDAQDYIARLNGVQALVDGQLKNSRASVAKGIMPPKYVYAYVISDAENILKGEPFSEGELSTLLADFKKKVGKLDLPKEKQDELYTGAITALMKSFKPAYDDMIAEMKVQQAKASTDDGAWKLPDGAAYYKVRLNRMTTTDMTPTEIHDLGLSEVARIHGEMRDIMKTVKYEGSLQEFFVDLKNDPKQYYEDSDAGREAYLKDAESLINTMKTKLDDVFIVKPKADLIVKQVEAFRNKSAGKAFYNQPAPDGSRPGVYYANLYKITDMPKYQMEALAYHEGIPGHHMQIAIQQELENIPKFRKFSRVTAYSEGWGLYSEYLPKEMGFYEDPYSDFGRLSMELWRAARLVVDTGLHDKKWTREEAIDYLTTNTPNPENDCIKAIERYIIMPGQATAYKIGMIKILSLREEAKKKLGDKFDIREYHNVIIASGPVPLSIMEERVDAWVEGKM